ncbi:proteasome inhibitor PI31 subunit [Belonocnema kinseyi]|uniref:proteasome inhibitor PI31 subunit n=1 Tax=Belonocnema kinseyi TaxID=2817044 RepID=UPI00143DA18D|nr:proteasome inhibitor PI31 subunit [Belonocnema kinseyi]
MSFDLNNTFGFELLNKIYDSQVTKKEDVLILFVHWYFIKNGFRCIGLGDSKTHDPAEKGSELLPEGWNQQPNYTLRYVLNDKLYILLGTKSEADFLLNLLRVEGHEASSIQFPIEATVMDLHGPLQTLIPTYQTVLGSVEKDLLSPIHSSTAEISTQTSQSANPDRQRLADILTVGPPQRPVPTLPPWNPDNDLRGIGRSDLDPLAPGGGGMLFDPFGPRPGGHPLRPGGTGGLGVPGRLPSGSVPPGARFDPFGPPDILRPRPPSGRPDNDHLPPPGYDDMFM